MGSTFRECYCARRQLPAERFEKSILPRVLYPHAAVLRFLHVLPSGYFAPDLEFVRGIGDIRSRRNFGSEALDFHYHPANRGFSRKVLRLRVSTGRMNRLVHDEFEYASSHPPFPTGTN